MKNGFSLIELLISMTLGLVISGGVIGVYISSQQNYQALQVQIEMQENANFTFNFLNEAFKQISFSGKCGEGGNVANTIVDSTSFSLDHVLKGYEVAGISTTGGNLNSSATLTTHPSMLASKTLYHDSDFIMVSLLDHNSNVVVNTHTPATKLISTTGKLKVKEGDLMAVLNQDCSNIALLVQKGADDENNVVINYNSESTTTSNGKNNCISNTIGGNFDCSDTSTAYDMTYQPGSKVYKIEQSVFALLPSSFNNDVGSLYQINEHSSAELVFGLKSMQFEYGMGVDDGAGMLRVSQYLTAREVTDWQNVVSIQVKLIMMATQTVEGQYPQKEFKSVFVLRNRMQ